ncbi:MAG: hypothetical protein ACJ74O_09200, partial [Frankiaceae bacterium]
VAAGAAQPAAPGTTSAPASSATGHRAVELRRLLAAESRAAAARAADCVAAPARLAPLLGSIAASETGHQALLRVAPWERS